ncbi:MAG: hypothetical protein QOC94_4000 [Actinoplanes sp.]|jgi:hypothetical protein|nr:hypothetical protein [Actinoplanes sp.]
MGSAGVNNLPDAERDACDVVQAMAGLAALLRKSDVELDDHTRVLLALAQHGGEAAARVLTYLHTLRGNGDGDAVAVPPRLGPWRDWVPARGHLLTDYSRGYRIDEIPHQPRRGDPGE